MSAWKMASVAPNPKFDLHMPALLHSQPYKIPSREKVKISTQEEYNNNKETIPSDVTCLTSTASQEN